jgi:calpain-7
MKAVKLASDENERKRLKLKCVKLLGRAEEIKQMKTWSKPSMVDEFSTAPKLLKVPVSTRKLSPREEIILLEGSKLHGSIFPAWRSHPDDSLFDNRDGDDPFV